MKNLLCVGMFSTLALVGGCSAFRVDSQFAAGRQELLVGSSAAAIAHFQEAADLDPNYEKDIGFMREGVWTYLGRANYEAEKLPEARQALERAVARDDRDYFANLYLGLVLAKSGDRDNGVKELKQGLDGLDGWFKDTTADASYGQFWDPSGTIRSEIGSDLVMLSHADIDWPKLITSGEWVGKKIEEEIDLSRRDEQQEYDHRDRRRMRED